MRRRAQLFTVLATLFSTASHAETATTQHNTDAPLLAAHDNPYNDTPSFTAEHDNMYFDQAKGVLFDQFSPSTYSLQLLQVKNKFNLHDFVIGGSTQLDWQHWQGSQIEEIPAGIYEQGNGFYLTQATLDFMENISHWSSAFFSFADAQIGGSSHNSNKTSVPQAFVVWGNLDQFPVYATTGISSIPFGVFSGSGPWDMPLTEIYFSPAQALQVAVAYYQNGLNAALTGFNDETNHQNHLAGYLNYSKTIQAFGYNLGISYLSGLKTNETNNLNIPNYNFSNFTKANIGNLGSVFDVNGGISYRQFVLNGEYVTGHEILNGNKNLPKAYALTANYIKNIAGKDTIFGISHSMTFNLQNVPAPLTGNDTLPSTLAGLKQAWAINASRPLVKNILLGFDLQKATTYAEPQNKGAQNSYTATLDLVAYL